MPDSRTTSRSRIPACRTTSRSSPARRTGSRPTARPVASAALRSAISSRVQAGARFAKKHVPILYFADGANHVLPLSRFGPHRLPDFAFVVPNLCHDMHDCTVAVGDAWLKRIVTPLLAVEDTVVFVVFDEGSRGNHVAAFALGTAVQPHSVFTRRTDHYGLLRTIEDMFGLPRLGAAKTARPLIGIWR